MTKDQLVTKVMHLGPSFLAFSMQPCVRFVTSEFLHFPVFDLFGATFSDPANSAPPFRPIRQIGGGGGDSAPWS